ncbi:MAG TPA: MacB family efflux pump subunit [Rhodanobacteraceae bacterium]
MTMPLLTLRGVERRYPAGDTEVTVLKGVDLDIEAGSMVAIVGPSGSGKSTLMNILGCLDRPSAGTYQVAGEATGELDSDALARLRREHFGFIFQSYNLIAHLPASANVEVPAIYSGRAPAHRHARAMELLTRLGLGERLQHRPGQLSGGQQQRVSIARALMNGGQIILADEPTGALDSHSGKEVMAILHELHQAGHTVILVTHDMQVAAHAQRIIEISDGCITADHANVPAGSAAEPARQAQTPRVEPSPSAGLRAWWGSFLEALRMAWISMVTHRLRTALTMLGLVIGISSVVTILALGAGARAAIIGQISQLGTATINIYPGINFGDTNPAHMRALKPMDVRLLQRQPFVDFVSPEVGTSSLLRYRDRKGTAQVDGVDANYLRIIGSAVHLSDGIWFRKDAVTHMAQVAIIGYHAAAELFPHVNPIGKIIMVGSMPATIIGVMAKPSGLLAGNSKTLSVWMPYTTVASHLVGHDWFDTITVRARKGMSSKEAVKRITQLLTRRHRSKDFHIQNLSSIVKTINKVTGAIELLLALIAAISLVVGGIGVMNIMLVSVTERTKEIGLRKALGAPPGAIRRQFLIEAAILGLSGGILGAALGIGAALLLPGLIGSSIVVSPVAVALSIVVAVAIGFVFGVYPAARAARLAPIDALRTE